MAEHTALHQLAVQHVADLLKKRHAVATWQRRPFDQRRGDLHAEGIGWVAVRASNTMMRRHIVTRNGRRYRYTDPVIQWAVHVHGKAIKHRPDWWALVDMDSGDIHWVKDARMGTRKLITLGKSGDLSPDLRSGTW